MTSATMTGPIVGSKPPGLRAGRILLYAALTIGVSSGSVTRQKRCQALAPSIVADS